MTRCTSSATRSQAGAHHLVRAGPGVRRRAGLLCGVLFAGALCLAGQAAHAHALLERAAPAVGSEVHGSPVQLRLTYTEAVEPAFSSVTVSTAAGTRVDKASLTTERDGRVVVVPLQPLSPGVYAVQWQVTSVDTHQTQGHFNFTIVP